MSDADVLEEQQPCNYSRLIAALQARKREAPKLRIANLSRDIVCLLTQGRTLEEEVVAEDFLYWIQSIHCRGTNLDLHLLVQIAVTQRHL